MPVYAAISKADNSSVLGYISSETLPAEDEARFFVYTDRTAPSWPTCPIPGESRLAYINGVETWIDLRSLAEAKAAKRAEINAARLAASFSYFTFQGKQIACDALSRSDIDGVNGIVSLTGAMPPNWVGGWKAMDNTYVAIPDVATWRNFFAAMVAKGTANFATSQAKKAQVEAATNILEVDAIDPTI